MAIDPHTRRHSTTPCHLVPFDPVWAEHVISWIRDPQEAYWLAPKTPPPLTTRHLLRWQRPDHHTYLMFEVGGNLPVAYGELNRLSLGGRRYWLGHLIVDSARRGCGFGVTLTRLLIEEGLNRRGAREVSLVVFPENRRAIHCYRAAGMIDDGFETHTFPAYGRTECLVRLAARRRI